MSVSLNYANWKNDHRSVLETLCEKRVVMLYSGGKDCSVILYYLILAGEEFGFTFETVGATFPNHVYPREEVEKLNAYWLSHNINITWVDPEVSDAPFTQAVNNGENPCYFCHKRKRELLSDYIKQTSQDKREVVVVISYTLWDIVSYSVEFLLGGVYKQSDPMKSSHDVINDSRFVQIAHRFYPFMKLKDNLSIFKPLLKYNDHEIIQAATDNNILYSTIKCEYRKFRPKRLLSNYYEEMNLQFGYEEVFNFYKNSLGLHNSEYFMNLDKEDFIRIL